MLDRHHDNEDSSRRHLGDGSRHENAGGSDHKDVEHALHNIEKILHHNPHDFAHVYKEVENLRLHDPKHFSADLDKLNKELHAHKYLPNLEIVQDDHTGKNNKVEHGYDIISKDKNLPPGNYTVVSTSHHTPEESGALRRAYHGMHYKHGKYNGWNQSAEGGHGGDGGFDHKAVGGRVPEGARKELIDKALKLAGLQVTPSNEAAVNKIVTRESAWNPNVTNHWDSNARAGHPSTGLMQTIPGTFQKWAQPGYNTNIHDPLSNLVAGIRYAQATYGHKRPGWSGVEFVASRPGGY